MARDISELIKELLLKHDCVIIPGFGAFIGNYFPARASRKEGLFEPPSRKITFNRYLTGNDGLLIGHVSAVTGKGYGEARDIVKKWSEELRSKIMTGNPVMIYRLGTFSLNYDGAIVFEPDLTVNYLLSSYGLSAYHRKPVSGFDVRKMAIEKRHTPAVSQPSMRSLLTRAAVILPLLVALALVPFNDRIFRSNIEESNLNPLARAELEFNREQIDADRSVAEPEINITRAEGNQDNRVNEMKAALGLTVQDSEPVSGPAERAVKTPSAERTVSTAPADKAVKTAPAERKVRTAAPAESAVKTAQTEAAVKTAPAVESPAEKPASTVKMPEANGASSVAEPEKEALNATAANRAPARPAGRTTAVVVEDYRYMVIIGSFKGEDNALVMVEKLRQKGYDPEVTGGPDGFLRVSAKALPTLDEAKVVLERLRREYPGAWVFKSR
ncbi:MAG: SPOR domain-containing protein [Bacteroidales bacterium]|nr:SPOR domain-containing protein [Bacteroidales bacterium]